MVSYQTITKLNVHYFECFLWICRSWMWVWRKTGKRVWTEVQDRDLSNWYWLNACCRWYMTWCLLSACTLTLTTMILPIKIMFVSLVMSMVLKKVSMTEDNDLSNDLDGISNSQVMKDSANFYRTRVSSSFWSIVYTQDTEIKENEAASIHAVSSEDPKLNLGFLHRMFEKCLPSNTAVFMFILVTFCLSASDAVSDMALSYYLYTRSESKFSLKVVFSSEGFCSMHWLCLSPTMPPPSSTLSTSRRSACRTTWGGTWPFPKSLCFSSSTR